MHTVISHFSRCFTYISLRVPIAKIAAAQAHIAAVNSEYNLLSDFFSVHFLLSAALCCTVLYCNILLLSCSIFLSRFSYFTDDMNEWHK